MSSLMKQLVQKQVTEYRVLTINYEKLIQPELNSFLPEFFFNFCTLIVISLSLAHSFISCPSIFLPLSVLLSISHERRAPKCHGVSAYEVHNNLFYMKKCSKPYHLEIFFRRGAFSDIAIRSSAQLLFVFSETE